eukprot:4161931-Prymnesium_polylepis.1
MSSRLKRVGSKPSELLARTTSMEGSAQSAAPAAELRLIEARFIAIAPSAMAPFTSVIAPLTSGRDPRASVRAPLTSVSAPLTSVRAALTNEGRRPSGLRPLPPAAGAGSHRGTDAGVEISLSPRQAVGWGPVSAADNSDAERPDTASPDRFDSSRAASEPRGGSSFGR